MLSSCNVDEERRSDLHLVTVRFRLLAVRGRTVRLRSLRLSNDLNATNIQGNRQDRIGDVLLTVDRRLEDDRLLTVVRWNGQRQEIRRALRQRFLALRVRTVHRPENDCEVEAHVFRLLRFSNLNGN